METILAQTCSDWELIVCDSLSDDGAWEFLLKFKDDKRIQLHQVPREGIYAGWNECLKRARGKFVYFATSDDTAEPTLLEKLVAMLCSLPTVSVATCGLLKIDEAGDPLPPGEPPAEVFLGDWTNRAHVRSGAAEFLLNVCFAPVWVSMTAVMFRRELLDDIGFFATNQGSVADADWALRASLTTDIVYTPEPLATWRIHSSQASASHWTVDVRGRLLKSLEVILTQCRRQLPESWQSKENWRDRLLAPRRESYRELFQLYSWNARVNPYAFARSFANALWREPAWALSRSLAAFPSGPELDYDLQSAAQNLFDTFDPPWPPSPLK